ncbi:MAG: nuclear transport factor 2 family protein [Flavobacteriaceae bacterium]
MKRIILPLCVLGLLISCNNANKKAAEDIALIEQYVEAVENLDHELMDSYLAEDYWGYGPSRNDSINKEGAVISWTKNVEELYKKIDYTSSRSMAVSIADGENQGDWVSNWAELEITFKEGDRQVKIWSNTVYKIENGKIARSYTFYNEADALEQLGYIFFDPSKL